MTEQSFRAWAIDPELERMIHHAVRAWPARQKAERIDSVMDVARLAFAAGYSAAVKANTNTATKKCSVCGAQRALHELLTPEGNNAVCKDERSCREAT